MEWKVSLKNLRISPRKVRLVADAIRGKSATEALAILDNIYKASSTPIKKLLLSAIKNAEVKDSVKKGDVIVSQLMVNPGPTMKRFRPRAFGRAYTIRKRLSHIDLVIMQKETSAKAKKVSTKETKKADTVLKKESKKTN